MAKFRSKSKGLRTFKAKPSKVPAGLQTLNIDRMGSDGRGVAKMSGKTVFVRGALTGESVRARIIRTHKKFDEADCIEVLTPSSQRVTPPCEYFNECGGCALQHLEYSQQLAYKTQLLDRFCDELGQAEKIVCEQPVAAHAFHYRHRARLAVSAKGRQCRIGFRRWNSKEVVDIQHCAVLYRGLSDSLPRIRALISGLESRSRVLEAIISEDATGRQGLLISTKQSLIEQDYNALQAFADDTQIGVDVSSAGVSEGTESTAWRSEYKGTADSQEFHYRDPAQKPTLPFTLTDFTQVNPAINEQLIELVISWLQLQGSDNVADYFCGIGNFTLPLAAKVNRVKGFELSAEMVDKASLNAKRNGIDNATFQVRNLFNSNAKGPGSEFNKVLLDPPRAGAEQLCRRLLAGPVEKVMYISCNPATMFRDARILLDNGFRLQRVLLADMFPQTQHCETVALFEAVVDD